MLISPYLFFNGNCEEAFKYYEKTFGGKIVALMPHEGSPAADQVPAGWGKKIMHARMDVGANVLMGSDAPPGHYAKPQGYSASLQVDKVEEAERIFKALADGGQVTMPIAETFWSPRFGMLTDRFGIPWMVNCASPAA